MADPRYIGFQMQLEDMETGMAVTAATGQVLVVAAGGTAKLTLADPLNGYAALANPVSLTRGGAQFAVLDTLLPAAASGAPGVGLVDLYIMAPEGDFVVVKSVPAGGGAATRPKINTLQRNHCLVCPYDFNDNSGTVEKDTGFDFPSNCLIFAPGMGVRVATTEGAKTIGVGILSTESGGNATGFMAAVPISGTAGVFREPGYTFAGGFPTAQLLGALVSDFVAGSAADDRGVLLTKGWRADGVAKSISYTPNTWAAAKGFFYIPYMIMGR